MQTSELPETTIDAPARLRWPQVIITVANISDGRRRTREAARLAGCHPHTAAIRLHQEREAEEQRIEHYVDMRLGCEPRYRRLEQAAA